MKLGLNIGYWGRGIDRTNIDLAIEADKLGFDVVWAAEAYGNDVVSTLAYVAAKTERIDVGSAVMQIPGRTPTMTAMTAVGLDINANHIRPVASGWVYGCARPLHVGASTQVWEIRITNEADQLVCMSRLTMAVIQRRSAND